ncbi:MAG TPA: molybdopterin-binding protein, partial [Alphaproteobacteria bacterium]|nr:molybdopterin-binding protein [Alphaproteobacteria bacterium]
MPEKQVTACVLIVGNEILSGRTKDANLPWLAEQLNAIGVQVLEARVIPDVEATIVAAVNEVRTKFDYVFTTGGIGPTHDDITAECVAKAFGVP